MELNLWFLSYNSCCRDEIYLFIFGWQMLLLMKTTTHNHLRKAKKNKKQRKVRLLIDLTEFPF